MYVQVIKGIMRISFVLEDFEKKLGAGEVGEIKIRVRGVSLIFSRIRWHPLLPKKEMMQLFLL